LLETQGLKKVLTLSSEGIDVVLKHSSKSSNVRTALSVVMEMGFDESIEYLQSRPYILQPPIVLEGKKCLVGYHNDEIRQFLPKFYRRRTQK
jgi:regulatory protein spx